MNESPEITDVNNAAYHAGNKQARDFEKSGRKIIVSIQLKKSKKSKK